MAYGDKEKKTTATAPAETEPRANGYTLTGDTDTDLENIASHYKPKDLDDVTWRGVWKSVLQGESSGNMETQESTYGKLPKGKRAFGPMQVTPKTAKGLGFTDEELKDPIYNFMAGVKNLRTEWDEIGKHKGVTSPEHRTALTLAAYHAGRRNVFASLDRGEDGVPDVDDGGINTRDYTFNKIDYIKNFLKENGGARESEDPQLLTDEELAARGIDESGQPARESKDQQPAGQVTQKRVGSILLGDVSQPRARKTFEEELVESDRRTREALGLIVPATAPRNFTGKAPNITMEVRRAQNGTLEVDENTLTDAVVFALTGDNTLGQQFRQAVGENPGAFLGPEINNQWLNEQVQAGNLKMSEVDGRIFVQGNVPVQNYVKNRLEAFAQEGVPGVARVTSEMSEETSQYERLAAEEGYGRRIMELRAQAEVAKDDKTRTELAQQADSLEAELEARYPTNWLDETWRGFKTGLARGVYNLTRTAANVKGLVEVFGMSDQEKVEATKRDKRVRAMEVALNSETPQARRWLGQAADAVTSEVIYAPMYVAGGMMIGPAGGIMTSALRAANKPMDEAMKDIAASIFELGAGRLIQGKWLSGTGVSPRKEFLANMSSGGFSEAGGDALIELAQGKAIDWNNALMNLVIGGAMEAGLGAREALKNQERPEGEGEVKFDTASAGAVAFDTEVRSPVFITRGENGQPRFGAVVRQGESFGFIEIPNQHPIIMKHAIDVEEGKASFVGADTESFDAALTEWKGTAEGIKLPKLNAAQLAAYLRGENPLVNEKRSAELKSNIEQGVSNEGQIDEGNELLQQPSGEQNQVQVQEGQGQQGQVAEQAEGQQQQPVSGGNTQVLTPAKTFRRYKNIDQELDIDLAQQWDKAAMERDEALRQATSDPNKINQGAMIRAGHVFTDVRREILAEQKKRNEEREKTESSPKKTTTKEEKPFEAGRTITTGGVKINLPEPLAKRYQDVQDDFKGAKKAVEEDKDLTVDEKKKRVNELKRQKLDEQNRIVNEFKKQQEESEQRGYTKGPTPRPLKIIEDRGDEVVVKLAGEDSTRVLPREEIETRKERALSRKSKTKLPLSVRTKSAFGTFRENRQASYASDGVVYINRNTQSKVEDALGQEIGSGYTFNADTVDETIKTLRDAGLKKLADQIESQKKAANGAPALVNVNEEESGLILSHERIHQKASGKDLPRSVVERLMRDDGNVSKMLNEVTDHPIAELHPEDVVHEILAYGLTGDYETLGVEPDFLYDALLDVVEAYVMAFPNEDLDTIFDAAVVDIDTIKDEANRRIKYGTENKQPSKTTVQATGDQDKGGKKGRSEGTPEKQVPEKRKIGLSRRTAESEVEAETSIEDINRKEIGDITTKDIKTIVTKGRFAAISGGKKTAQLKKELERMGYKVFESEGKVGKSKTEPSLFVILKSTGDEANMIRLASRFDQSNVLLGDNGNYRAPFTESDEESISGGASPLFDEKADKRPENTVVKTNDGEISFSIPDIDSDIRKSDAGERKEVAELTRAYEKSFENKPKATTADLTQFLQEQMNLKKRKQRQVSQVGEFLEQTVKKMYGKYPDEGSMSQEEYDAQRVRRGVADLLSILDYEFSHSNKTEDETGLTWYTSTIEKMHQRTGQAFPEVLSMPQMRVLFDLTLALSSPANKVNSNYKYTTQLWTRMISEFELGMEGPRIYPTRQKGLTKDKETGQMRPKKYGKFGPLLDKFNNLSEGYIPVPSKDVEKVKESGAEMRQTQDFADIKGATQWYAKEPELERLISKYGKVGGVLEFLLTPLDNEADPFRATQILGPKVGAFFLNIAGFNQLVTVDSWISRWFYMLNGGLVNKSEKSGVQDDPKNDHDGDIIRGIMQATAKQWNDKNPDMEITPEDVQAITWYHIKNIFFLAGAKDSGNVDFAQAAENVLSQKEIVEDIDGTAAVREAVIERFTQDARNVLGPKVSEAGTGASANKARNFFVEQMANGGRVGLAHTKRKDVVNRKLSNFDAVEWNKFMERAKGDDLDASEKKALYTLLQKGYAATTEKQRLKVKEELISFGNSISSQGVAEFLLTVRKAGMLSGIKTTGRNILSNAAFAVLEEMNRGVMGPIDVVIAAARGKERSVQGMSPLGILRALKKTGTEGLKQFKDTMMKGNANVSFEDIGYDPKLRPFLKVFGKKIPFATGAWFMNNTVGQFAKFVFRFQKAQDVLFRTYAYNRALYEVAVLKEKNQKIPIAQTLANPSAADSDVAWRAAEVMVFQNDNAMNTAYQRFKSKQPKAVKYLLDYQLPFIKTGSNIFARTMDYLGIGGVYKVAKLFDDMDDKQFDTFKKKAWEAIDNPEARKVIVGAFSRGLVGLGIATIGWFMAAAGQLNGMDDDDIKERNRRIAEGSGPGHIKIGDKWRDIRGISPVGTILLSGASAYRAFNKDLKDESKRFDAMLAVASSILVDGLPLARAASDYVNPKSGRSVAQRLIGAESVVPAIVSEYAAHRDDVQRNTKGDTLTETIKNSVKARIPGKREELPAKTDVFGRELEQPSGFNPLSTKKAKDDKVLKEASSVGWSMTPPKRDTKNNETAEVFEKRKKKTQELIYKIFDKVVNDAGYSSDFTKPERKEILDEAAGIARRTVKNEGKLTDKEIKDVVNAVLEKAKVQAGIERDAKMDAKEKAKAKQSVSTQFSSFIGGPTRD